MGPNARRLLRRIALGLPIAVVPTSGLAVLLSSSACTCTGGGNCGATFATTTHAIDAAQRAALMNDAGNFTDSCREVCLALDVYGPGDAGLDAGGGDTNLSAATYSRVTCSVSSASGSDVLTCSYAYQCIGGRAPSGLAAARVGDGGVGGWLARAAWLERASVPAFEDLARELVVHGAPASLVRAAVAAADDERRHADAVAALATRRGSVVPPVRREPVGVRTLAEVAHDNAVEGCVREAYAALVAARQAARADDADVRAVYATIAPDEARHALLSAAIHAWAMRVLPGSVARDVEASRRAALEAWRSTDDAHDLATGEALGLPSAVERDALLAMLV